MSQYTEKINKMGLYNARMISHSKSWYRSEFPYNLVAFNGVMCILENDEVEKIWYGDLDINKDGDLIKNIAKEISKTIYILRESEFFYSDKISKEKMLERAIWNTDFETPSLTKEDVERLKKEDIEKMENNIKLQEEKEQNEKELNKTLPIVKTNSIHNRKVVEILTFTKENLIKCMKQYQNEIMNELSELKTEAQYKEYAKYFRKKEYFSYKFVRKIIREATGENIKPDNITNYWATAKTLETLSDCDYLLEKTLFMSNKVKRKDFIHYLLCNITFEYCNKMEINIDSFEPLSVYILEK